mmetsp:Transcript_18229/g.43763  ORF Transcript_18229/g.43763 Transcript_18229/m.43763 type:complete len:306 (-) Transcript_18229:2098-3015(-)
MQHQHELAALALRIRRQPGRQRGGLGRVDALELLGELAADRHPPRRRQLGQHGNEFDDAMRRLEQDLALGFHGQHRLQRRATLTGLGRQEARKGKAGRGGVTRHTERRHRAAGPRQRQHAVAGRHHGLHQHGTGVGDGRRAGIRRIRHAFARRQPRDHAGAGFALVVLVQRDQRLVQAKMAQQRAALARVLTGQRIGQAQQMDGAQGQVGQVADGRGHQVERAGRILLAAGRGRRGLAQQGLIGNSDVQLGLSFKTGDQDARRCGGRRGAGASRTRRPAPAGAELSSRRRPQPPCRRGGSHHGGP